MNTSQWASVLWRVSAAALVVMLLWLLREPMLIVFGAILLAATLRSLADPLARVTPLSPALAVGVVTVLLLLLIVGMTWVLGATLSTQLQALQDEVPKAWQALQGWLRTQPAGHRVLDLLDQARSQPLPWHNIASAAASTINGLTTLVIVLLTGLYLAFDVSTYRNGALRLFPPSRRRQVGKALDATGHALKRWVLGQAVTMAVVGVTVAAGMALLGMPMALALGLIAALLEFIPFFGPIVAGALAVLVAFAQGPQQALVVALVFLAIQQLEGNVLVPMVQRWAVALPPALVVISVLMFGTLFGIAGVLLATPLAVVTMVLVQRLYVEDTLEKGSA